MLERAVLVFVLVALGVLVTVPILVERRVGELREQVEADVERVVVACREQGARDVRTAESEAERARLWEGRKGGIGAIGTVIVGMPPTMLARTTLRRRWEFSGLRLGS